MTRLGLAAALALAGPALGAEAGKKAAKPAVETAAFAAGCFWCVEAAFEGLPGVLSVVSGYTGGRESDPTYEEVSRGGTGHAEAVEVRFDPSRISYDELLDVFWANVDPTADDRQFCDKGRQYRPAVFARGKAQLAAAKASVERARARLKVKAPIKVEIVPAGPFYEAEEYHQDYHSKNPIRYRFYRRGCGRDARLLELWGDAWAQGPKTR